MSERTRLKVHDALRRVAENIATAHGTNATVTLKDGYPVTVNDAAMAGQALDVARGLFGAPLVHEMPAPVMGAEDFSYVLQQVPGAMVSLGACPPALRAREAAPNHSNRARFDEQAMLTGMALHTGVALHHLSSSAN